MLLTIHSALSIHFRYSTTRSLTIGTAQVATRASPGYRRVRTLQDYMQDEDDEDHTSIEENERSGSKRKQRASTKTAKKSKPNEDVADLKQQIKDM